MPVVPQMTDEQRKKAFEKAVVVRRERAEARAKIRAGKLHADKVLAEAKDNPVLGRLYVRQFLKDIPGIGDARCAKIMQEVGIADNRRLAGLGDRQIEGILDALA